MSDETVTITNYPPNGVEGALIGPVYFGPGAGPIRVLLELEASDDGEGLAVAITIGGGPEHEEIPAFLTDIASILSVIAEQAPEEVAAAVRRRAAEIAAEGVDL